MAYVTVAVSISPLHSGTLNDLTGHLDWPMVSKVRGEITEGTMF